MYIFYSVKVLEWVSLVCDMSVVKDSYGTLTNI